MEMAYTAFTLVRNRLIHIHESLRLFFAHGKFQPPVKKQRLHWLSCDNAAGPAGSLVLFRGSGVRTGGIAACHLRPRRPNLRDGRFHSRGMTCNPRTLCSYQDIRKSCHHLPKSNELSRLHFFKSPTYYVDETILQMSLDFLQHEKKNYFFFFFLQFVLSAKSRSS